MSWNRGSLGATRLNRRHSHWPAPPPVSPCSWVFARSAARARTAAPGSCSVRSCLSSVLRVSWRAGGRASSLTPGRAVSRSRLRASPARGERRSSSATSPASASGIWGSARTAPPSTTSSFTSGQGASSRCSAQGGSSRAARTGPPWTPGDNDSKGTSPGSLAEARRVQSAARPAGLDVRYSGGMNSQPNDPRVFMAAERTFLAWVRTGLALMGFGFVVARFGLFLSELASVGAVRHQGQGFSLPIGIALIGLGIVVIVTAAIRHHRLVRSINEGRTPPGIGVRFGLAVAALLALIGLAMAVYLAMI
ncbi:MAG: hypothetical protein B7Z68_02245 [Acidobacteria bacterium 21-70-11]|nr:MAG: hypothetical protein B7Z68_02245 [Acidobacteria bacterium 21-70-11]